MYECGRTECVYRAVQEMIKRMKEDIAKKQNLDPENIVVADIYNVNAAILAEACRRNFKIKKDECKPSEKFDKKQISFESFILLKILKEDGLISPEYGEELYNALIKIKPQIEALVKADRELGLI